MSRLIFILIIIALVYWLLTSYRRRINKPTDTAKPADTAQTQDMVSCAHCGVHLPKGESLQVDGKYFCCEAHSRGKN